MSEVSNLYKKHLFINKNYDFIVGANIKEYDMKSGGFNILISYNALSPVDIERLKAMPKEARNIVIGKMQRSNKELTNVLNEGFTEYRRKFFEANNIDDMNILAIRKDAIFTVNAKVKQKSFDNITFSSKNRYSSYYLLNDMQFLYSKSRNIIDIKGISDEMLKYHENYMLAFMKKLFGLNEVSNKAACDFLYKFADDYRNKKLKKGFYRELNSDSKYRIKNHYIGGNPILADIAKKKDIDIMFNYNVYIKPLINYIF